MEYTVRAATGENLVTFRRGGDDVIVTLSGAWLLRHGMPAPTVVEDTLEPSVRQISFESEGLAHWDSSLVNFLIRIDQICRKRGVAVDHTGLPEGLQRLIKLAEAVSEIKDARAGNSPESLVQRVGAATLESVETIGHFIGFVGEVTMALMSFFAGRARFRRSDLLEVVQSCGADALGIVTLISYLVGAILAFMGAVQLEQFGAAIYVADLVAIGIVREMGAMMTAIIMAGRTGAAFAAQLGTMKVTQEIDALATMGISPMQFLVLPRTIALVLMMPLLCLYSDIMGILGGATVGVSMLGLSLPTYLQESVRAVHLMDLGGGLLKGAVYGVLIAIAGCYEGFECGNSSSAVGDAATRAVVSAIVMIVVACGLFAVLFHILHI